MFSCVSVTSVETAVANKRANIFYGCLLINSDYRVCVHDTVYFLHPPNFKDVFKQNITDETFSKSSSIL